MADLTPADLARWREEHQPQKPKSLIAAHPTECRACGARVLPCPTIRLCDALEAAWRENHRLKCIEPIGVVSTGTAGFIDLADVRKLEAALEAERAAHAETRRERDHLRQEVEWMSKENTRYD